MGFVDMADQHGFSVLMLGKRIRDRFQIVLKLIVGLVEALSRLP